MIFNIPTGGAKKITVTINGGIDEAITYTGKASGSVTLNNYGTGSVVLRAGTYTFTGGVSGYSTTVTLKNDGAVNVHPNGALFWYGNGYKEGDTLYSKSGGWTKSWYRVTGTSQSGTSDGTFTLDGTALYCSIGSVGNTTGYAFSVFSNNAVDMSGYSTLKCSAHRTGSGKRDAYLFATTAIQDKYPKSAAITLESSEAAEQSADVSALTGNHYVAMQVAAAYYGANGKIYAHYDAIWLE